MKKDNPYPTRHRRADFDHQYEYRAEFPLATKVLAWVIGLILLAICAWAGGIEYVIADWFDGV